MGSFTQFVYSISTIVVIAEKVNKAEVQQKVFMLSKVVGFLWCPSALWYLQGVDLGMWCLPTWSGSSSIPLDARWFWEAYWIRVTYPVVNRAKVRTGQEGRSGLYQVSGILILPGELLATVRWTMQCRSQLPLPVSPNTVVQSVL